METESMKTDICWILTVTIFWTIAVIIRCLQTWLPVQESTEADVSGDAVSNPDAPAPLEDDEAETTEDNNAESDGITNEEAGLE